MSQTIHSKPRTYDIDIRPYSICPTLENSDNNSRNVYILFCIVNRSFETTYCIYWSVNIFRNHMCYNGSNKLRPILNTWSVYRVQMTRTDNNKDILQLKNLSLNVLSPVHTKITIHADSRSLTSWKHTRYYIVLYTKSIQHFQYLCVVVHFLWTDVPVWRCSIRGEGVNR